MTVAKVDLPSAASCSMRARLRSRSSRTPGSTCSGRISAKGGRGSCPSSGFSMDISFRGRSPFWGGVGMDSTSRAPMYEEGQNALVEVYMSDQYDLIVIGGGSGGLAAAKRAAEHGARVVLI